MTVDPDIVIGRPPARRPLLAELGRRDRAVAAVLSLVARGRSVEAAVDSVRVDGRAVCLDVLVAVGAFADRPPAPEKVNGHSMRFVDETWTTLSCHRCRLRRPLHPRRGHR